MQKHKWTKYLDSQTTEICEHCNTFRKVAGDDISYVHPDFGSSVNEPDCPPVEPVIPHYNDLQVCNLVGLHMGLLDWYKHGQVETVNVYDNRENLPVATFHGHLSITFRSGVPWYVDDLKRLLELHQLWRMISK